MLMDDDANTTLGLTDSCNLRVKKKDTKYQR